MTTRSGGPKTSEGKAVTRYNAAKHGVYTVTPVLPNVERQADWLKHRAAVFNDLRPEGYMQEVIAERIAVNTRRLRRLARYERSPARQPPAIPRAAGPPRGRRLAARRKSALSGRRVRIYGTRGRPSDRH